MDNQKLSPKQTKIILDAIASLEDLADKLRCNARPGHVAYLSKKAAAQAINDIVMRLLGG